MWDWVAGGELRCRSGSAEDSGYTGRHQATGVHTNPPDEGLQGLVLRQTCQLCRDAGMIPPGFSCLLKLSKLILVLCLLTGPPNQVSRQYIDSGGEGVDYLVNWVIKRGGDWVEWREDRNNQERGKSFNNSISFRRNARGTSDTIIDKFKGNRAVKISRNFSSFSLWQWNQFLFVVERPKIKD